MQVGKKIGELLTQGIIIALTGDLGSGKTVFVQGLAKGLEISEKYYINSPTYTLVNEYPGRLHLAHADLYRLGSADDIESTGLYDLADGRHVVAVEWANRLDDGDFPEYLELHIGIIDDDVRRLDFSCRGRNMERTLQTIKTCFKEQKWL